MVQYRGSGCPVGALGTVHDGFQVSRRLSPTTSALRSSKQLVIRPALCFGRIRLARRPPCQHGAGPACCHGLQGSIPDHLAKDRFALSRGHYHWQREPCWYAGRNGSANWKGDCKQSTLWQIPAREGKGFEHGTQKPVEC